MTLHNQILEALQFLSTPEKRDFLPYFFKTGKGEYAEGDQFIGVVVPDSRKLVKEYWQKATLDDVQEILKIRISRDEISSAFDFSNEI